MDKVLDALKCTNCRKTLSSPVFLPCGHMICKAHAVEKADEQVLCVECGTYFPNSDFAIARGVEQMIQAQLDKLNFGPQHSESWRSCNELKKLIDKNDSVLNDLEFFIHEPIDELRKRVMLRGEQLKLKVDQITKELIDELDEYEATLKANCHENLDSSVDLKWSINELKEGTEIARKSWQKCSRVLNELIVNEEKWREFKEQCDLNLDRLNYVFTIFNENLFTNEFDKRKLKVDHFENANIDEILRMTVNCVHSCYF